MEGDKEKDKEKVKKPKAKAKAPAAKTTPAKTTKTATAVKAGDAGDGAGKEAAPAAPVVPRLAPPGSTGKVNKAGMVVGSSLMGLGVRERVRKAARGRGRGRAGRGRGMPAAPGAAPAVTAPGSLFSAAERAGGEAQEEGDVLGFKGQFSKDVRAMMYGFGDDLVPLQETADLVEDVMLQYLASVVGRAASVAADSLKPKVDERDVLFVVRKDPAKFARVKELLVMQQVIRDARNSFKEDLGPVAAPAAGGAGLAAGAGGGEEMGGDE